MKILTLLSEPQIPLKEPDDMSDRGGLKKRSIKTMITTTELNNLQSEAWLGLINNNDLKKKKDLLITFKDVVQQINEYVLLQNQKKTIGEIIWGYLYDKVNGKLKPSFLSVVSNNKYSTSLI